MSEIFPTTWKNVDNTSHFPNHLYLKSMKVDIIHNPIIFRPNMIFVLFFLCGYFLLFQSFITELMLCINLKIQDLVRIKLVGS